MNATPLHMDAGTVCVPIADIRVDRDSRFRKDLGDIELLKSSIMQLGLLQPIGITPEHTLVYGERRLRACKELGWDVIESKIVNFDALMSLTAEFDENECRKQFTQTERVAIGEEIERRQGERRGRPWDEKKEDDGEGESGEDLIKRNCAELESDDSPPKGEQSRDYAAKRAGFTSGDQYERAKRVVHRGIPELQDAMDSGRVSISAAAMIAELPEDEQRKITEKDERQIIKEANEIRERKRAERKERREIEFQGLVEAGLPECHGSVTIHNVDCYEGMLTLLDSESIDLIVTSPPYNVNIEYDQYSDDLDPDEYFASLEKSFIRFKSILKPGGRACVNVPFGIGRTDYFPFGPKVMELLRDILTIKGVIIWNKNTTGNRCTWGSWRSPKNPALRDTCELVIVARRDGDFFIPDDRLIRLDGQLMSPWLDEATFTTLTRDIWDIAPENKTHHPAPFPVKLAEDLIKLYGYPGCRVLDPYAGSGTVGVACINLGAEAVLMELDEKYCQIAQMRCAQNK